MISGQCHCGNVQISIPTATQTATSCNCSICFRVGAIWGHLTEQEVEVTVKSAPLSSYSHGDHLIRFHHCSVCGCHTHYTSVDSSPTSRLSVNYRMFAPTLLDDIIVRKFDGAGTWQFIE
ncbi:aldehyde-activating protein [Vibrio tapetis subsp. quintayensis]|uniref:GFA family protein n=1 Tax=Vibrio tapetis TaxID=52443 RepID=UPI0025B3DF21|nr:aldehyde-activating protein [Vibrio tapetis]MDN3681302.1 aldehyde-activating protein [Vibrio tapetis subsp. quintayensis]